MTEQPPSAEALHIAETFVDTKELARRIDALVAAETERWRERDRQRLEQIGRLQETVQSAQSDSAERPAIRALADQSGDAPTAGPLPWRTARDNWQRLGQLTSRIVRSMEPRMPVITLADQIATVQREIERREQLPDPNPADLAEMTAVLDTLLNVRDFGRVSRQPRAFRAADPTGPEAGDPGPPDRAP